MTTQTEKGLDRAKVADLLLDDLWREVTWVVREAAGEPEAKPYSREGCEYRYALLQAVREYIDPKNPTIDGLGNRLRNGTPLTSDDLALVRALCDDPTRLL